MQYKPLIRSTFPVGSVSVLLLVLTASTPAFAGFQWVAPGNAPSAVETYTPPFPSAPVQQAPVAPKKTELLDITPQIIEAPTPVPPSASAAKAPASVPEHILVLPKSATAAASSETESKPVRGFGNSVPLSVALRQILPSDMGFAVDPSVSLGQTVSWKGGAPWREVLTAALKPAQLMMEEDGQVVRIVPGVSSEPAPSVAAASSNLVVVNDSDKTPDLSALSTPSNEPVYLLPPASPEATAAGRAQSSLSTMPSAPTPVAPAPIAPASKTMGYLDAPHAITPVASSGFHVPVTSPGSDALVEPWTAEKGEMLRQVLQVWCRRANVELTWQAEYDFPLQASVSLNGTFEDAVRGLLRGFEGASPQPLGTLHNNQVAGQSVLVVTTRGNKYDG